MQKRFFLLKGRPFVFLSATGHGTKGAKEEAALAFDRLNRELKKLGGSIDDVVRITVFTKNQECRPAVSDVRNEVFPHATRPSSSSIIVHDFSPGDTVIEVDATAFLSKGKKYHKKGFEFDPPRAYIKAIEVEDILFISGQTGRGENIEAQTASACSSIDNIMTELGSSWKNVLQVSCYIKRLELFDIVHRMIQEKIANKLIPIDLALADEYAQPGVLIEIEVAVAK